MRGKTSRLRGRSEEIKKEERGRGEGEGEELRRMRRGLEPLCSVSKPSIKASERERHRDRVDKKKKKHKKTKN